MPAVDWKAVRRLLGVFPPGSDGAAGELDAIAACIGRHLPHVRFSVLMPAVAGQRHRVVPPGVERVLPWPCGSIASPVRQPLQQAALEIINGLQRFRFDAAVVFSDPGCSPYLAGYLCRIAGIATRVGCSREFGGAALTHRVPPPPSPGRAADRPLQLLAAIGLVQEHADGPDSRSCGHLPATASARPDVQATASAEYPSGRTGQ